LEELRLAAVEDRIEADLTLGGEATLIVELEALVAEHPHRERLRGQLMLALYRAGRQHSPRRCRRLTVHDAHADPAAHCVPVQLTRRRMHAVALVAVVFVFGGSALHAATGTPLEITRGTQLTDAPWAKL